jgi:hypothetical protein
MRPDELAPGVAPGHVPWIEGAKRYHQLPRREPAQVYAAFRECFTSPAGQLVMDELYRVVCCTQLATVRDLGKHDLWVYILDAMQQGELLREGKRDATTAEI